MRASSSNNNTVKQSQKKEQKQNKMQKVDKKKAEEVVEIEDQKKEQNNKKNGDEKKSTGECETSEEHTNGVNEVLEQEEDTNAETQEETEKPTKYNFDFAVSYGSHGSSIIPQPNQSESIIFVGIQQKNLRMIGTMSKNKSTSNSHEVEDFEWMNPKTLERFAPMILAYGCAIAATISVGLLIGFIKVMSKGNDRK